MTVWFCVCVCVCVCVQRPQSWPGLAVRFLVSITSTWHCAHTRRQDSPSWIFNEVMTSFLFCVFPSLSYDHHQSLIWSCSKNDSKYILLLFIQVTNLPFVPWRLHTVCTVTFSHSLYCDIYTKLVLWHLHAACTVTFTHSLHCDIYTQFVLWHLYTVCSVTFTHSLNCDIYTQFELWHLHTACTVTFTRSLYCDIYTQFVLWHLHTVRAVTLAHSLNCDILTQLVLWYYTQFELVQTRKNCQFDFSVAAATTKLDQV